MPWFAEGPLLVYLIRIGPDAHAFGDPYLWSFPLALTGEFKGVSTTDINAYAVRTAREAGRTLLGKEPFWRHQHRRKTMDEDYKCTLTWDVTKGGKLHHDCTINYYGQDYAGMHGTQKKIMGGLIELGDAAMPSPVAVLAKAA